MTFPGAATAGEEATPGPRGSPTSQGPVSPPNTAVDRWAPGDLPRLLDGIVIPAASAAARAGRPIYTPAGQVKTVSSTGRGVGFYSTAGQWVLVWEGDNTDQRDTALRALLDDLARHTFHR